MNSAWLILGNQLFPQHFKKGENPSMVFMAEDHELCTHFKYHKHKIILFLTAMRRYAAELQANGTSVHYMELTAKNSGTTYEQKLKSFVQEKKITQLICFEIEDKFMESRLKDFCRSMGVQLEIRTSPMFLTTREEFQAYLKSTKKPFMKTFYEAQRKRLKLLLDSKGKPLGGKWSFDTENRKPLKSSQTIPLPLKPKTTSELKAVQKLVDTLFKDHPGKSENFWIPTSRQESIDWLDQFIDERLAFFGDFEDAMTGRSDFVYHSVLTPILNLGLITPEEVIQKVTSPKVQKKIPLNHNQN
ncbi:cryptochrome/photolyase family protein [bacterium]|nr:cryptochrome/photolyase family protein [bacterium]